MSGFKCTKCDFELSSKTKYEVKFCPSCGTPAVEKFYVHLNMKTPKGGGEMIPADGRLPIAIAQSLFNNYHTIDFEAKVLYNYNNAVVQLIPQSAPTTTEVHAEPAITTATEASKDISATMSKARMQDLTAMRDK